MHTLGGQVAERPGPCGDPDPHSHGQQCRSGSGNLKALRGALRPGGPAPLSNFRDSESAAGLGAAVCLALGDVRRIPTASAHARAHILRSGASETPAPPNLVGRPTPAPPKLRRHRNCGAAETPVPPKLRRHRNCGAAETPAQTLTPPKILRISRRRLRTRSSRNAVLRGVGRSEHFHDARGECAVCVCASASIFPFVRVSDCARQRQPCLRVPLRVRVCSCVRSSTILPRIE